MGNTNTHTDTDNTQQIMGNTNTNDNSHVKVVDPWGKTCFIKRKNVSYEKFKRFEPLDSNDVKMKETLTHYWEGEWDFNSDAYEIYYKKKYRDLFEKDALIEQHEKEIKEYEDTFSNMIKQKDTLIYENKKLKYKDYSDNLDNSCLEIYIDCENIGNREILFKKIKKIINKNKNKEDILGINVHFYNKWSKKSKKKYKKEVIDKIKSPEIQQLACIPEECDSMLQSSHIYYRKSNNKLIISYMFYDIDTDEKNALDWSLGLDLWSDNIKYGGIYKIVSNDNDFNNIKTKFKQHDIGDRLQILKCKKN